MLKKPKRDNLASEWIGLIWTVTGTGSNCPSQPWTDTMPDSVLSPPSLHRVVFSGCPPGSILGLAGLQAAPGETSLG